MAQSKPETKPGDVKKADPIKKADQQKKAAPSQSGPRPAQQMPKR